MKAEWSCTGPYPKTNVVTDTTDNITGATLGPLPERCKQIQLFSYEGHTGVMKLIVLKMRSV